MLKQNFFLWDYSIIYLCIELYVTKFLIEATLMWFSFLFWLGGVAVWELQGEMFNMLSSACEHDDMTSAVSVSSDASQMVSASYDQW